jgi:hypothetical protein
MGNYFIGREPLLVYYSYYAMDKYSGVMIVWWFAFGCGVGFMVGLFYRRIEYIHMHMMIREVMNENDQLEDY